MSKCPYEVLGAISFWTWIDEHQDLLHRKADAAKDVASEGYKLFLMGQQEMLHLVADYLHQNEMTIERVVTDDNAE